MGHPNMFGCFTLDIVHVIREYMDIQIDGYLQAPQLCVCRLPVELMFR